MSNYDQADFYLKRAESSSKNNQHQKAIELYTQAINYCQDDRTIDKFLAPALLGRGVSYWLLEEYEKSIEDCNKVIEISPNRAKVWAIRGACYYSLGKYDNAIDDLKIALEIDSDYIGALDVLSSAYEMKKEFQLGLVCILKCIKAGLIHGTEEPEHYSQAGNLSMKLGKYDDAIGYLRGAISVSENYFSEEGSPEDWAMLGRSFRLRNGTDDLDQALGAINHAIELNEEFGWIWAERGSVYQQMGKFKNAIDDFRKALSHDESSVSAQKALEECLRISGEFHSEDKDLSIQSFDLQGRGESDIVANDDNAEEQTDEPDEKERYYRDLIAKAPNNIDAHLGLGAFLVEDYRLKEAEPIFREIIAKDPKNKKAYNSLLEVLVKQGKIKGAEMVFRLARQNYPDDENLYIDLAKLQIDNGFVKEAENICWQAIQKFPDLADAYYYLAKALQGQVRWQDAEIAFLQAIEKNPKSVLAYFNLGVVLAHQRRFEEAESAFRYALEIDPDYHLASWNMTLMQSWKKQ